MKTLLKKTFWSSYIQQIRLMHKAMEIRMGPTDLKEGTVTETVLMGIMDYKEVMETKMGLMDLMEVMGIKMGHMDR